MNKKINKPASSIDVDMKKIPGRKRALNRNAPSLLALEARLMFDGAVAQTVDQTPTQQPEAIPQQPTISQAESAAPAVKSSEPVVETSPVSESVVAQTVDSTLTQQPESVPQQTTISQTESLASAVQSSEPVVETVSYVQPKNEQEAEKTNTVALTEPDSTSKSAGGLDSLAQSSEISTVSVEAPQRVILASGYLPELDQIVKNLPTDASIHILRAEGQIVQEITQILSGYDQINQLHIISHGHPGSLVFGKEVLDTQALNNQADQIRAWGARLAADADILLYGCDVAAEETGVVFLKTLQGLTSADIAASDDTTGAAALDGDAILEVRFGEIESSPVLTSELLDRLNLVLDTTPPHVSAVEVNMTDTTMRVILTMSEAVAINAGLTESQLRVTIAGVDRLANYVAPVTGNLLTSNPAAGLVVYGLSNVTAAELALGVTLSRVVLNSSNAPIEDLAGVDLIPVELNQLLSRIHVDAGESVTFNGGFSGTNDFVKTGAGELILGGNNIHTGKTIIEGGTLSINSDLRLGATTNTGADRIVIKDGATLKVTETLTLTTGRGIQVQGAGRIEVATGASVSYGGVIIGADSTSGLTKAGAGELTLSGLSTFTGPVLVEDGRLKLSSANRLANSIEMSIGAAGVLDMTAGVQTFGSLAGAGRIEIAGHALTVGGNNSSTVFSGDIVGTSGSLVKMGTGVLTLSGESTYTGVTTLNAGTLQVGANQALSQFSAVTLNGTAVLDLNGAQQTLASLASAVATTSISLGGAAGHLEVGASNSATTFAGVISGDGKLTKRGTAIFTLSGPNTYTGETFVAQGTLALDGAWALGPSTRTGANPPANTAVVVAFGATLDAKGFTQRVGSLAGAGTLTLGNSVFNVGTNNLSTEFTGIFTTTGTGAFGTAANGYIVKEGTGTLTLGGFTSNASGRVLVESGTLVLDKANGSSAVNALTASLGVVALEVRGGATVRLAGAGDTQISPNADVILHTNATLDLNGRSLTINRLTGAGLVTNGAAGTSIELIIGNGGAVTTHNFTFGGVIQDGAGKTGLVLRGTSLITLAQVQTYTGETRIEAGSLILTRLDQLNPATALNVVDNTAKLVLAGHNLVVSNLRGGGSI
jgi:autotransporter-associated beta strand protein